MNNERAMIDLTECDEEVLNSLPKDMVVDGSIKLNLSGVDVVNGRLEHNFLYNKESIILNGDLDLRNSLIEELPSNMIIKGDLNIYGCKNIKQLPSGLEVEYDMFLSNSGLTHIDYLYMNTTEYGYEPSNLYDSSFYIKGCDELKYIKNIEYIYGNIEISYCKSLEIVQGISLFKTLIFDRCPLLKTVKDIGQGYDESGIESIDLEGCAKLTTLKNIDPIGKDLNLSGCSSLKTLPSKLVIKGDLYVDGCFSLKTLPNDLKVKGTIYVDYHTGFIDEKYNDEDFEDRLEEYLTNIPEHLRGSVKIKVS